MSQLQTNQHVICRFICMSIYSELHDNYFLKFSQEIGVRVGIGVAENLFEPCYCGFQSASISAYTVLVYLLCFIVIEEYLYEQDISTEKPREVYTAKLEKVSLIFNVLSLQFCHSSSSIVNYRVLYARICFVIRFCYLPKSFAVCLSKTLSYDICIFSFLFCEALRMTSHPLKPPGHSSKRKCRKRVLSISSHIFHLVSLFSIVYTVYQFVPSHKSKSNLLSKYQKINVFPHFVLNSYRSVSYSFIICLATFYLVISIHKLETSVQV